MRAILQRWNVMRMIRLVLGVIILVQGIITKDIPAAILGIILGGMAAANIGCCATNACAVNPAQPIKKETNINHEKLDTVK